MDLLKEVMFTTSVQRKTSPFIGYLLYRNIAHLQKNRDSEIVKWKVRTNPSKTTVTSQIGSAKIVFKSLMHRMALFKFNLCKDIGENPGPGARRHFMN